MKEANLDALKVLYEALSENKKRFLKDVVNSSRVETLDGRSEPRKIVKVRANRT